jgi:hypothetical protein
MKTQRYLVTRLFIGGLLEGLTYTAETSIAYQIGFTCHKPIFNGSPYTITEVIAL